MKRNGTTLGQKLVLRRSKNPCVVLSANPREYTGRLDTDLNNVNRISRGYPIQNSPE
jgi:hypothetical protein